MSQKIKKEALQKPPFFISYLITDPEEFGNTPIQLKTTLSKALSYHDVDIVCFRDKVSLNIKELAQACLEVCRKFSIRKVLINSHIELCEDLGFDGVHLNSLQFEKLESLYKKNIFTIISCHSEKEIRLAKKHHASMVTYSPIFFKEKKGKPKGLDNLSHIISLYQEDDFKIIALGGIINNENIYEVQKTKAGGFASIRYFKTELFPSNLG